MEIEENPSYPPLNRNLNLEDIPVRGVDEDVLVSFCLSIDAYRYWGDEAFDKLDEIDATYRQTRQFPKNTDDLRAFLFMVQRAHRHGGGPGDDFPEIFYEALEELRRRILQRRQRE